MHVHNEMSKFYLNRNKLECVYCFLMNVNICNVESYVGHEKFQGNGSLLVLFWNAYVLDEGASFDS